MYDEEKSTDPQVDPVMPFRDVEPVAIGLGSNVGDRLANLARGVFSLRNVLNGLLVSSVYETDPADYLPQPGFLNACCIGSTRLPPRQLMSDLQDAERRAGRRREGPRFGPRELDLDILLYGDLTVVSEHLTIPHPRMRERAFVLVPLAEIAADWVVPAAADGCRAATVGELAAATGSKGVIRTELKL